MKITFLKQLKSLEFLVKKMGSRASQASHRPSLNQDFRGLFFSSNYGRVVVDGVYQTSVFEKVLKEHYHLAQSYTQDLHLGQALNEYDKVIALVLAKKLEHATDTEKELAVSAYIAKAKIFDSCLYEDEILSQSHLNKVLEIQPLSAEAIALRAHIHDKQNESHSSPMSMV